MRLLWFSEAVFYFLFEAGVGDVFLMVFWRGFISMCMLFEGKATGAGKKDELSFGATHRE